MKYNKECVEIKVQKYDNELILCFFEIEDGPMIGEEIDTIPDFKALEYFLDNEIELDQEGYGIYFGEMEIHDIQNILIREGYKIKY